MNIIRNTPTTLVLLIIVILTYVSISYIELKGGMYDDRFAENNISNRVKDIDHATALILNISDITDIRIKEDRLQHTTVSVSEHNENAD